METRMPLQTSLSVSIKTSSEVELMETPFQSTCGKYGEGTIKTSSEVELMETGRPRPPDLGPMGIKTSSEVELMETFIED